MVVPVGKFRGGGGGGPFFWSVYDTTLYRRESRGLASGAWDPGDDRHGVGKLLIGGGSVASTFLSTAAVWCVPYCLDCSVPWVYAINFKRKKNWPTLGRHRSIFRHKSKFRTSLARSERGKSSCHGFERCRLPVCDIDGRPHAPKSRDSARHGAPSALTLA